MKNYLNALKKIGVKTKKIKTATDLKKAWKENSEELIKKFSTESLKKAKQSIDKLIDNEKNKKSLFWDEDDSKSKKSKIDIEENNEDDEDDEDNEDDEDDEEEDEDDKDEDDEDRKSKKVDNSSKIVKKSLIEKKENKKSAKKNIFGSNENDFPDDDIFEN